MGLVSTYIHHHIALTGKLASGGFHINWLTNTKRHTWGHPWWLFSITKRMVKHSQIWTLCCSEQGWIGCCGIFPTLQSKRSSGLRSLQEKWRLLFSGMCTEICWLIWQKRPGCWPNEFLCMIMLDLTVLLQTWISWISSFIQSCHWLVQNATIPCHYQDLLPFLSVIYSFLPSFNTN